MTTYFITGTDTDAGKTYASGQIIEYLLSQGKTVCYFKSVQSGKPSDTDYISRYLSDSDIYNCYSFDEPAPPHRLAQAAGIRLSLEKIEEAYLRLTQKSYDYILVEGAGGAATPLDGEFTFADIALRLNIPTIIVARGGLGTINHSIVTHHYLRSKCVTVKGFIINNVSDTPIETVKSNAADIGYYTKSDILAIIEYNQKLTGIKL